MKARIIKIGKAKVGVGCPAFIIAEAGVNHNGNLGLAKRLVDVAKEAGADAVKFQTFKADDLVVRNAPPAAYQQKWVPTRSQYKLLKQLELSYNEFDNLFRYCQEKRMLFLSTPFDLKSAEFLNELGVAAFKIGSGDLNNIPLILRCAHYGKPMILSTGMSTLAEIRDSVNAIYRTGNKKVILLHCTSNYPTVYENVHLRAGDILRKKFNLLVGYSDHTLGTEVSIASVAREACILEKHFTLSKNMKGPDHQASLDPRELKSLIQSVRIVERALGDEQKTLLPSERQIRGVIRRSLVTQKEIHRGDRFTECNISIKRPGRGLAPKHYFDFLGKISARNLKTGSLLRKGDIAH